MYDNSFYGSGTVGGWTVTIGDTGGWGYGGWGGYGGYGGYGYPYPPAPYPATSPFGIDSTLIILLVLGVLIVMAM